MEPAAEYDVIVVGGGSAGCVMASRLSEDPARRVLLVEAGPDTPPDAVPPDISDSYPGRAYLNAGYRWPTLKAYFRPVPHNDPELPPLRQYEQARVMGGGSSINGQIAVRGAPADYDEWAASGAAGWAWDDVLPYFRRLERDLDFQGPHHGQDGPIPIRRVFPDRWDGLAKALADVLQARGLPYRADMNADFGEGYAPAPFSNSGEGRVSAALGYLSAAVRRRPNLHILAGTEVDRILVEDGRATGVALWSDGAARVLRGRRIVLSCGALHSPKMLMLSGIGPGAALQRQGIATVADLAGVGQGLQDHPAVSVSAYLARSARFDAVSRRHIHVHTRYSSGEAGCPPADMVLNSAARSAWHPLGLQLGSFQVFVAKTYSRGTVTLASADPRDPPDVRFNALSDPRDCHRLMHGVRFVADLLRQRPLSDVVLDPFPSSYSAAVQRIGRLTFSNAAMTRIASWLMEGPAPLRRRFIAAAITGGQTLDGLLADSAALETFVRHSVSSAWHPCSTCRMGAADDPAAVVDPQGRVRGVAGLWVADASVMPAVPRANTNIPTIMVGEKMAAHVAAS